MTSFSISVQRYVRDVSFNDTGYKNNKYKVETCWRFCVFVSKLILHFVHNVSCLDIKLGSVPGLIVYFYKIRTIQVSIIGIHDSAIGKYCGITLYYSVLGMYMTE